VNRITARKCWAATHTGILDGQNQESHAKTTGCTWQKLNNRYMATRKIRSAKRKDAALD